MSTRRCSKTEENNGTQCLSYFNFPPTVAALRTCLLVCMKKLLVFKLEVYLREREISPLVIKLRRTCRDVTKKILYWNQRAIELIDEDNGYTYYAGVHCTKNNKKVFKKEKFIRRGLYKYAKKKKLRRGEMLSFTIRYPAERMFEGLLNR
ncbi:unnamed protein product [Vicia faba]|uniref:Uncharacterized protein n=1 Tax=Vicia faba TaxID=3906 RepID=A0AAV1AKG4_VICFA|nr:unnamed protein product [Vicia faba]